MSKWPKATLLEVARLTRGTEPGSTNYTDSSHGVRFLRVGDVTGKTDKPVFTDSHQVVLVDEEDILLTLDGSPGYVSTGHKGAISSGIRRVESIDSCKVFPAWLKYSLMSALVQETIRRHTIGMTILHASAAIPHIRIPLPPPSEQERILRILNEGEALLRLRIMASRRTSDIAQALFSELLQTRRIEWKSSGLEILSANIVDCPHSTPIYAEGITDFPCVRSSDIQDGRFDWTTTKYVDEFDYKERVLRLVPKCGDVVYCREGARLGNAAIIPKDISLCLGQRMMLFRANPLTATPEYVWALLNSTVVRNQVEFLTGGAASPHINIRDIRNLTVPVPPLNLQESFSEIISKIREVEAAQSVSQKRLDDLFHSLLDRAFQEDL